MLDLERIHRAGLLVSKIGFEKGTASAVPLRAARNAGFSP
jgi:hypothetical protein